MSLHTQLWHPRQLLLHCSNSRRPGVYASDVLQTEQASFTSSASVHFPMPPDPLSSNSSTTLESTKSNYWANGDLWARSGIRTFLCLLLTISVAFAVR